MIDSRGRILRPSATESTPGLLSGMPVSPGMVTGPVKVLHSPHDKTVEKRDVLVAREYGKPCVVGIDRVVSALQDGEIVEVNGTTGTVRRLSLQNE